eukprot:scaffold143860_cov33-Prasinocladus_malaysianus.AAC.1
MEKIHSRHATIRSIDTILDLRHSPVNTLQTQKDRQEHSHPMPEHNRTIQGLTDRHDQTGAQSRSYLARCRIVVGCFFEAWAVAKRFMVLASLFIVLKPRVVGAAGAGLPASLPVIVTILHNVRVRHIAVDLWPSTLGRSKRSESSRCRDWLQGRSRGTIQDLPETLVQDMAGLSDQSLGVRLGLSHK